MLRPRALFALVLPFTAWALAVGCGRSDLTLDDDFLIGDEDGGDYDGGDFPSLRDARASQDALADGRATDGRASDGSNPSDSSDGSDVTDAPGPCALPRLIGTLRDFHMSAPDFEKYTGDDRGIVETLLGTDGKPVYASAGRTVTTTGAANFNTWYNDVPGVNLSFPYELALTETVKGTFVFDSPQFFPLDGIGFGNEGRLHNFSFTFELHTQFIYRAGDVFKFTGDDDVWVFINNQLAVDLGGIHRAEAKNADLDALAGTLGIQPGNVYDLALFQAERHSNSSDVRVETTLSFVACPDH